MDNDIVPKLLKRVEDSFHKKMKKDERIQQFLSQMESRTAVSEDVARYSQYVGEHAAKALSETLTEKTLPNGKLYFNIANRIIRQIAEEIHRLINEAAVSVMETENKKIRIGLKAMRTDFPEERVRDLIDKVVELSAGKEEDGKRTERSTAVAGNVN